MCKRHPQDLYSFPTALFFLWHSSVSNQICQKKVIWPMLFCISRSYSLEQTPAQHQACFVYQLFFRAALKNWTFSSTKYVIFHSRSGDRDTSIAVCACACVCVCVCVCVSVNLKEMSVHVQLCSIYPTWLNCLCISSSHCLLSFSCYCEELRAHLEMRHSTCSLLLLLLLLLLSHYYYNK